MEKQINADKNTGNFQSKQSQTSISKQQKTSHLLWDSDKQRKTFQWKMVTGSWTEIDITFDTRFYLHTITVNIGTLLKRIKSLKLPKTEAQRD